MKHALDIVDHAIGAADTFGTGIAKNLIKHRKSEENPEGRDDDEIIKDLSPKHLLDLLEHSIEKFEYKEYCLTQLMEFASDLAIVVDRFTSDPYGGFAKKREELMEHSKRVSGTIDDIKNGKL